MFTNLIRRYFKKKTINSYILIFNNDFELTNRQMILSKTYNIDHININKYILWFFFFLGIS